jgi:hypothetical protein
MRFGAAAVAALALALAACEKKPEQAAAPTSPKGQAAPAVDTRSGDPDAVAAVLQSPGAPAVSLAFVVGARPVVGKPFALKLLVSAAEPVPALELAIESADLIVSPATGVLALASAGTAAEHELVATPRQEGISSLTVRLRASPDATESVYVVPVLVPDAQTAAQTAAE